MGIYTRPDSPYFWMAIEQPHGGKPLRSSTGLLARGLTPEQRKINQQLALRRYAEKATTNTATEIGLVEKTKPRIRFNAYADWYDKHAIKGDERESNILVILRKHLGPMWLHEIDKTRVTEYMTVRTDDDVMPRTVNREIDLLKSMLRDACPKYLDASPIAGMKRLKVVAPRRHYTTESEEDKIVRVLETERDYVGLAMFYLGVDSLVRLGDLLDFQRQDDRGRSGWIQDPKDPRQSEPYTFPISKRARKALNKIPDDGPFYFARFRVAKNPRDWRGSVRQWLERVCELANVKYGRDAGGVTWHWGTRRTGASRMIRRKTDLRTVQDVGNWKDPEVVLSIYSESFTEEAARAVEIPGRRPRRFTSRSREGKTRGNIPKSGR